MTSRRNTDPKPANRPWVDREATRRAVEAADLRALLMMVFHYTGDRYWLSDRFRPARDVRLIAPEDAGLPDDVQREIRDAAATVLVDVGEPAMTDPDDPLLLEMMGIALGEHIPAEYVSMMREQMGFVSPLAGAETLGDTDADEPLTVLIVGAGESGIALGAMLNDLGIGYQIVERAETVGGTWRDNVYPGCAVDTPNYSYSYSFSSPYRWSRYFSERGEIQDYLERCADEFAIREQIRFGTRCLRARWDEGEHVWQVLLENDGRQYWVTTRFLVSAIGPFGDPQIPDFEGLDSFRGPVVHSVNWPRDLELHGKAVAIVGTGASAMQIGPSIADDVAGLTIFQRTPQWVRPVPRFHDRIDADMQVLLEHERYYSRWYRFVMMWRYGDGLLATLRKDPDWPHPDRSVGRHNDRHREQMTRHIHQVLGGRVDLLEKCLPSYPPYGKRILLDNGWYETLLKHNVELVTTPIARLRPAGIRLRDDSFVRADILILATGFDVSCNAARLDIRGRDGLRLAEKWSGGIGAYLGITVTGFPNFLVMQGPNTGLGHGGSLIFTAEVQARYIALTIQQAMRTGVAALEVKPEVYDEYLARVDAEHAQLVWTHPGTFSYYRNEFGKVRTLLPWRMVDYFHMARQPNFDDFHLTYHEA